MAASPQHTVHQPSLRGPYASLPDLLGLRHRATPAPGHRRAVSDQDQGSRLSKLRGRGVDFAEVRAYQPGDDVRTIDWRVTARKNKPHTKVFREERERLTLVMVDQTQSMFFGSRVRLKSVAAAEVAATIAWQGLRHNDRVGGMVLGNREARLHKPRRSSAAVARFLSDIAKHNQMLTAGNYSTPQDIVKEALQRLHRLARQRHRVFCVSDFRPLHEAWEEGLRTLARRNELVVVQVFDPLEAELPRADQYTVTDGINRLQFDAGNPALRQRYSADFGAHHKALQALCRELGARGRLFATTDPADRVDWWA